MITIIGGSGFIGTRLCKLLDKRGAEFEILDLQRSRSFADRTKVVDIREIHSLRKALTGTSIVHLAAAHRDDLRDKSKYQQTNVHGTDNICRVAVEKGIRRLIFTSSVAVYGAAAPNTTEDTLPNPNHEYGKTKLEAERILHQWHRNDPDVRSLLIVRPTVVFGEGNRGNFYNLLNAIYRRQFVMIGHGNNKKSVAYVGNLVNFLGDMIYRTFDGITLNYSDPPDLTTTQLVALIDECFERTNFPRIRLPFALAHGAAQAADSARRILLGREGVISMRIRKFCADTHFKSNSHLINDFVRPYSLREAIDRTIRHEFKSGARNSEVFYSE